MTELAGSLSAEFVIEEVPLEENLSVIERLKRLSTIDASIARLIAERKKLNQELAGRRAALKKSAADLQVGSKSLAERQLRFRREEASIKDEREKLVARRMALSSLNNYKLQQAGEREIEHASRQINAREEALLATLDALEKFEADVKKIEDFVSKEQEAIKEFESEVDQALSRFEEQEIELGSKRADVVLRISPPDLGTYERIRERFPMDAIIAVKAGSCSGCFIQVAPQLLVQIAQGDKLVRCRGCGRILYNDSGDSSAGDK